MTQGPDGTDGAETPPILVLGGGVCGLYAALTLCHLGERPLVIEKESTPGGLARGEKFGKNFFDHGVHMLHAFDREVFETVRDVMGDERTEVALNAQIRWAGGFYRYPLQFPDMVKGMHKWTLFRCVLGLFAAEILNRIEPSEPKNAEDALVQLYGWPLYEFFFEEFTWRYWGIHPREISPLFVTSKMPRLTAADAVKKVFSKFGLKERKGASVESALREETLHYSRTGAEAMPRLLATEVERKGGRVRTGCTVETVQTAGGRATAVTFRCKNRPETIGCRGLLNTTPLPAFVRALEPAAPGEVLESSRRLQFKAIAILGLLVKKERALDALYVYYRNRVFHRVGEPKNAGLKVTPPDHTVLIVEMTCEVGDSKWRGDDELFGQVCADLAAEGVCCRDDIVGRHLLRAETGYPVYSKGFEPHHRRVRGFVDGFSNVRSAGRQGAFCFPNMHSAMRLGKEAAESLHQSVSG